MRRASARSPKAELELATALIEQFTGKFEPEKYEDTYRNALLAIIKAKQKGKTITAAPVEEDEEPADLLAALKASVDAAKKSKGSVRAKRPRHASASARARSATPRACGSRRRGGPCPARRPGR